MSNNVLIRISPETRNRLRNLNRGSYEDAIKSLLDGIGDDASKMNEVLEILHELRARGKE